MNRRDPFYHQVQKVVTTEDVYFWLGHEEQLQEAIVQDDFDNLVDNHESEDQGTDVADIDSSIPEALKEPLSPR